MLLQRERFSARKCKIFYFNFNERSTVFFTKNKFILCSMYTLIKVLQFTM